MTDLNVAIVGAGMIGTQHMRSAARAGAQVLGMIASTSERSQAVTAQYHLPRSYQDLTDILADDDVDVVHICSPNYLHFSQAQAVLKAGKHVICEKPLALTLEQAHVLSQLALEMGRVATVPYVYRYHPMVREARARFQQGEIGALQLIQGSYLQDWLLFPSDNNWRVDPALGGASRAFADIGSHLCDLLEWVTDDPFVELVADLATTVPKRQSGEGASFSQTKSVGMRHASQTEDVVGLLLRTRSGVLTTLTISQVSAGRKNRLWFELDGAKASLHFDQEHPEELWLGARDQTIRLVKDPLFGDDEQRRMAVLPAGHAQGYDQNFVAFFEDTYAKIRGESPVGLPTFVDGARSLKLIKTVLQSARIRAWVACAPT